MNRPIVGIYALVAVAAVVILGRRSSATKGAPTESQLNAEIESLRADLREKKTEIVSDAMKLNSEEAAAFWPIYKEYESDVKSLNDDRVALVKEYAEHYKLLTDEEASTMAKKSLDLESRRTDLKKRYLERFGKKLPGTTVARFFQLEHRLDLVIDVELASELPPLLSKKHGS